MSASHKVCTHCGVPSAAPFCCTGCEAAHALVSGMGMERFYALQDGAGLPVGDRNRPSTSWLERMLEEAGHANEVALTLDVEGLRCAGCVWLIQTLFQKKTGAIEIVVNPGRGQIKARTETTFPWLEFVTELDTLGYRTGPGVRDRDRTGDGLLIRFGVAVALAMNAMILSGAFYFGLEEGDALHDTFLVVGLALATLSVLVGLPVFLRGVWQAAKRRVVHLDLPIALGIILTYVGSLAAAWQKSLAAGYFDTLTVFIALVLFGRLIQRRAVQRNRRRVLEESRAGGLTVRRRGGALVLAEEIRAGNVMILAPGDCLVVDAVLLDDARGLVSAWTTGEPDARDAVRGTSLVAGTQNLGDHAVCARAEHDFSASTLVGLLELPDEDESAELALGQKIAGPYVALVLGLATLALIFVSLEAAIGILVVTCPCALGLALPLAREQAIAQLASRGLFVRRASVLERVLEVDVCAFDKTGTLTAAALEVDDRTAAALEALSEDDRAALRAMVSSSGHPKSRALLRALGEGDRRDGTAREVAGVGLTLGEYTLGRSFAKNARVLLVPTFHEVERAGARRSLAALRSRGLDVMVLSGDRPARVREIAQRLGLDEDRALGGLAPEDKARFVRHRSTLMIGDGINDAPALRAAHASGAVLSSGTGLSGRADFFCVGHGAAPINALLDMAQRVRQVVHRNLAFALVYNVVAISLCFTGHMSPLVAAVLMPASSLFVVVHTSLSLRLARDLKKGVER